MIQSASERWNLFLGDKNIWNLILPHSILFHKGIEDKLRLWAKFDVLTKHTAPYHIEIVRKIVLNDYVLTFDASPIFQGIEVSQSKKEMKRRLKAHFIEHHFREQNRPPMSEIPQIIEENPCDIEDES